ncbi:MAG: hypothetical protein EOO59_07270 [Hymenobacter sp.]|nr:MAG: hypothetical protein EOO59_07270 [Hymenobacter sp.]
MNTKLYALALLLLASVAARGQAGSAAPLPYQDPDLLHYPPAQYPAYTGPDLGLTFAARTGAGTLRVWAPTAAALRLRLYAAGSGGSPTQEVAMTKAGQRVKTPLRFLP